MKTAISKAEAARRQLDSAIKLWFENDDGLSIFTLAFASLKVLFGLHAHGASDGFSVALDKLIGETGWKSMSSIANFLKHADRDPGAALSHFHPDMGMPIIGLATLLYRRLTGDLSLRMKAFDSWTEIVGADELNVPELDQNATRAEANKRVRDALKSAPRDVYMRFARRYYDFFLTNHDQLKEELNYALAHGVSIQQFLDSKVQSSSSS